MNNNNEKERDLINCLIDGIRNIFNNILKSNLLYIREWPQYFDIIDKYNGVDLIKIYGTEHLLRLFYKWPWIMNNIQGFKNNKEYLKIIKNRINLLLKYLNSNSDKYLVGLNNKQLKNEHYQKVNKQYIKRCNNIKIN